MKTIWYLKTCSTCKRILASLPLEGVTLREIKKTPPTGEEIDLMARLAGSYEALFSRRSRQFRARGLHEQELGERDYRAQLLDHYSFLKRPVGIVGSSIFVGNAASNVERLKAALEGE